MTKELRSANLTLRGVAFLALRMSAVAFSSAGTLVATRIATETWTRRMVGNNAGAQTIVAV